MSAARTSATWTTAAGTTTAGMADARTSTWTPYPARSATLPAMPAHAAAPAEAAAEGITAPVEAGSAPAIVIPAVILSAVDELSLFHIAGDRRRHEAIDGESVG